MKKMQHTIHDKITLSTKAIVRKEESDVTMRRSKFYIMIISDKYSLMQEGKKFLEI